eukprot:768827-Pyramimonas_sp.AAC.1
MPPGPRVQVVGREKCAASNLALCQWPHAQSPSVVHETCSGEHEKQVRDVAVCPQQFPRLRHVLHERRPFPPHLHELQQHEEVLQDA